MDAFRIWVFIGGLLLGAWVYLLDLRARIRAVCLYFTKPRPSWQTAERVGWYVVLVLTAVSIGLHLSSQRETVNETIINQPKQSE